MHLIGLLALASIAASLFATMSCAAASAISLSAGAAKRSRTWRPQGASAKLGWLPSLSLMAMIQASPKWMPSSAPRCGAPILALRGARIAMGMIFTGKELIEFYEAIQDAQSMLAENQISTPLWDDLERLRQRFSQELVARRQQ
jgi:hypothetical protein